MDKHVRRSGDDYVGALAALLPTGPAWPRDSDSALMKLIDGMAQQWGRVDARAADLLEQEADPRTTYELIDDWERNWGLPDPCFAGAHTISERRVILIEWMTLQGGQSRAFFIAMAARIGYAITITEYSPFTCGISECGDTRDDAGDWRWEIGPSEIRYYWTVHVGDARLTWFRAGGGELGVNHHLEIGLFDDLECMIRRWKPSHTEVIFDYSGLVAGGAMAGTP